MTASDQLLMHIVIASILTALGVAYAVYINSKNNRKP